MRDNTSPMSSLKVFKIDTKQYLCHCSFFTIGIFRTKNFDIRLKRNGTEHSKLLNLENFFNKNFLFNFLNQALKNWKKKTNSRTYCSNSLKQFEISTKSKTQKSEKMIHKINKPIKNKHRRPKNIWNFFLTIVFSTTFCFLEDKNEYFFQ